MIELASIKLGLREKDGHLALDLDHVNIDDFVEALESWEGTHEDAQTLGSVLREFVRKYDELDKHLRDWIKQV